MAGYRSGEEALCARFVGIGPVRAERVVARRQGKTSHSPPLATLLPWRCIGHHRPFEGRGLALRHADATRSAAPGTMLCSVGSGSDSLPRPPVDALIRQGWAVRLLGRALRSRAPTGRRRRLRQAEPPLPARPCEVIRNGGPLLSKGQPEAKCIAPSPIHCHVLPVLSSRSMPNPTSSVCG